MISSPAKRATITSSGHHRDAVGHLYDLLVVGGGDQDADPCALSALIER